MTERLCVFCKHWYFSGGERGYSEMTPGTDASMTCLKGHYDKKDIRLLEMTTEDFRAAIEIAITCKDYLEAKP